MHWLERSPKWNGTFDGFHQNEVFFPELQPLERAYSQFMGNLAQRIHDIGESRRIRVSGVIQQVLRKPISGVRMGDMPDVPTGSKELYSYIANRSNCLYPYLIQDVVEAICIDELSDQWKDYKRELVKCLGMPLCSGKRRKLPLSEAEDLASMSVKVARHPEQFPITRVLALQKYFLESVGLDLAVLQGYTEGSTALYFAIPKAAVPFIPSLLLSHVAQLRQLEVQKIAVFGYFAVDLEEAQAYALVSSIIYSQFHTHKWLAASCSYNIILTTSLIPTWSWVVHCECCNIFVLFGCFRLMFTLWRTWNKNVKSLR